MSIVCPALEQWQAYVLAHASEEEASDLEEHLASCAACRAQLNTLRGEDALIQAVRAGARSSVPDEGDLDRRIARRLRLAVLGFSSSPADDAAHCAATTTTGETAVALHPPQGPDEIGRLGDYRIVKVLGAGGMGIVYLAEDVGLKRHVALKAMKPILAASATASRRFLREAQAVAAIKHPNIVTIHQVGQDRGIPFIAMEFLEGESLEERLHRKGKLSVAETLRIGRQIALGLAEAHKKGLIHRDVKPANVWLEGADGNTKILDFGLARGDQEEVQITQEGTIIGTPAYMAPEQAGGESVDARADLFSLGCVLYRMCTGEMPFTGQRTMAVLLAVMEKDAVPAQRRNPAVPRRLSDLIDRLLAKKPAARPASAAALADEMAALSETGGASTDRRSWRRWLAAGVLLAMIPIMVLFGGTVMRLINDEGVLVVEADDDELEIAVKQGQVFVKPRTAQREFVLAAKAGEVLVYERGQPEKMLATKAFELRRGRTTILSVRHEVAEKRKMKPADAPSAGTSPFPDDAVDFWKAAGWDPPRELVAVLGEHRQRHEHGVSSLAFSPDGKSLASGGTDYTRVYDVQTMKVRKVWLTGPRVYFCREGQAVASLLGGAIWITDIDTGKRLELGAEYTSSLATTSNGTTLAAGRASGRIDLYDVTKDSPVIKRLGGHTSRVIALAISPDGSRLVSADDKKVIKLWNTETGKELVQVECEFPINPDGAALTFVGNDKIAVVRWNKGPRGIDIWQLDKAKARIIQCLVAPGYLCVSATSSGDKLLVGSGYEDSVLYVWNGSRFLGIPMPPRATRDIRVTAISPDGATLATGSGDGAVKLWKSEGAVFREVYPVQGHICYLEDIAFSPDGQFLATAGSHDQLVRVWKWNDGRPSELATFDHRALGHRVYALSFSPLGGHLLTSIEPYSGPASPPDCACMWSLTGDNASRKPIVTFGTYQRPTAILPNGKHVLMGAEKGTAIAELRGGQPPTRVAVIEGVGGKPVFSRDRKFVALRYAEGVKVFSVDGNSLTQQMDVSYKAAGVETGDSHSIDLSPNGKFLAVARRLGRKTLVLDLQGTQPELRHTLESGFANPQVAFSPTGNFLVTNGSSGMVRFWDMKNGDEIHRWKMLANMGPMAFSPDGKYLAMTNVNANGTVYVFRVPDFHRPGKNR